MSAPIAHLCVLGEIANTVTATHLVHSNIRRHTLTYCTTTNTLTRNFMFFVSFDEAEPPLDVHVLVLLPSLS